MRYDDDDDEEDDVMKMTMMMMMMRYSFHLTGVSLHSNTVVDQQTAIGLVTSLHSHCGWRAVGPNHFALEKHTLLLLFPQI